MSVASGSSGELDSLYQEIILDHYKHPHHAGLRDPYEAEVHHVNPTCGDEVTLRVHLSGTGDDVVIEDVSYDAEGCSISQAATSVMTDLVVGRQLTDALSLHDEFLAAVIGHAESTEAADVVVAARLGAPSRAEP